jgi:hypothetical protein
LQIAFVALVPFCWFSTASTEMKHVFKKYCLFLILLKHSLAAVIEITDASFDDLVAGEKRLMIDIHAPW